MRVISVPEDFNVSDLFVDVSSIVDQRLYLKCEGFNFAGSVKLKAATEMITRAERAGVIHARSTLVESSSGNLGVALSMVAASRGYHFVCVTDSRCTLGARQLMRALGSEVHIITDPHPVEGLLGARIRHVKQLCADNADFHWLNQYTSEHNWGAHYRSTGPEILSAFPDLDVLFVGAGTAGTLMGCARYIRKTRPEVRIVAVDSIGSVTFGGEPGPRMIPGLGSGVRSPQLDESYVDDVVMVAERLTVQTCWELARHGFLFGGSTGTVLTGAVRWYTERPWAKGLLGVAIAPDLGDRYLDTVYHPQWVADLYGEETLTTGLGALEAELS